MAEKFIRQSSEVIFDRQQSLYGFIHRTFQEYFAAADIHERYLQGEDTAIVSEFLMKHLHDPHWQEVI